MNKSAIVSFIEEKEGQQKAQMVNSGTIEIVRETEKAYNLYCQSNYGTCYIWVPKYIADKADSPFEQNYSRIVAWLQDYNTRSSLGIKGLHASRKHVTIWYDVDLDESEIDPENPEETTKIAERELNAEEQQIVLKAFQNK